ncbi:hypothetical protein ACIBOV_07935 [Micromonospora chersina]|uniref:hypothetical protein n=1 Tax=Micromonospora chersina TaxID=47854 RepID=UPI003798AB1C
MGDDIVLRLDHPTAEDLYVGAKVGEHMAAGAAITPSTAEEAERLGARSEGPGPRPWPSLLSLLRPPLVVWGAAPAQRQKSKRPFTQPMIADHKIVVMQSLLEVITSLQNIPAGDGYLAGPTIYAKRPWTPSTDAVVLRGDGVPEGLTTESGHHYLLEVDLAIEAIEVWSEWRAGVIPTPEEATLAVIYYGKHDAYQPLQ